MKSGFFDKLVERLDRLDPESLQTYFLRLAQEKGLLETIFQAIQEGVIVVDGQGRLDYANRAAERFLGFTHEQVKGRSFLRYLKDVDWGRVLALDVGEWSKLIRHEIEVTYPEHRFLDFYVVPLSAVDSREKGAVIILRDITRDRQNEATMMESERLNAVRLLAAGVAHEVGNPLNALGIHLQLLEREMKRLDSPRRDELVDLVEVAQEEISRLDLIITQFLRAIRPAPPNRVPMHVDAVLNETLRLLKQEIENRRIRVEVECPAATPRLRLDKDQMKQAFFNLVKNALQAMTDGGRLSIAIAPQDRFMEISFQDTGAGIAPENFIRIFDPYFTTKADGSGLGLMIVQRIVQDHGGRMDVRSEPGVGTTVTVLLPLDERRVRLLKPATARSGCGTDPEEGT